MELILGQTLALFTALCFAQNSLIYAHVGAIVSSSTTAHIRLWIAVPLILVIHLIFQGTLVPIGVAFQSWVFIGLSGVLGFCIADLFIFSALVKIGARQTMVIMTTSPIFSTIFAYLIEGEVITAWQAFGMTITLLGVAWVILVDRNKKATANKKNIQAGVAFAILGALTQAGAMVLAKKGMAGSVHPISANVIRLLFGLISLIIFTAIKKSFFSDFKLFMNRGNRKVLILIILAAIVGPVLGIILNLWALSIAPVGIVTTLSQMTPVLLLPLEKFVLKRYVSPLATVGTFIAVLGTVLLFISPASF
ncbi:MAG: DMT family transporter [Spirochaetia bacterium]|nr:DMT family transporter [Spirochaetia bacterium]